ncbi:MAG: tetratricopeptide repeat protein, partial [Planctomycetota bacterium]
AVDHVADAHRERGNFQKARQCGEYIADHWPDADHAAEAQAGVVRASILMGDEIGAQAAMNELLTSFSSSTHIAKAMDDVAKEYREAGQYENARQWHQYVVDHWPEDEHALDAQGDVVRCSILLGDEAGAQAAIDKLLADFGGHENTAKEVDQLANLCLERRDYIKARYLYQYIATSWPTAKGAVKTQSDLIRCSIGLGDETGAQAAYDDMLAAFSNDPRLPESMLLVAEAYTMRGVELDDSGDLEGAQQYYRRGVGIWEKLLNDFPSLYAAEVCCHAGDAYSRLNEPVRSLACFQKVLDHHPDYRFAWHAQFMVGRNYEKMKELGSMSAAEADPEITAAYEQLLQQYPTCPAARYAQEWLDQYISNK